VDRLLAGLGCRGAGVEIVQAQHVLWRVIEDGVAAGVKLTVDVD
jgi:hypothetical protein